MKKAIGIVFIFFLLAFFSCSPVYVPNTRNAALFRGAGEFQSSIHFGEGIDAQGAVSITDHIGLMGNYNYVNRNTSQEDASDKYVKHKFWEAAAGYYENTDKICYEIFAGYGRGEGSSFGNYSWFSPDDVLAKGTYGRFFVQPSIGSNNHIFNWIVSTRISYVDFENFTYGNQTITYSSPAIFFEPAFTGRIFFGQSPIYTQFQTGFSFTTQGDTAFDYQPFQFSFGLGLRLGGKPKVTVQQP